MSRLKQNHIGSQVTLKYKDKITCLRKTCKTLKYNAVDSLCGYCYILMTILHEKFIRYIYVITISKQKEQQKYDTNKNAEKKVTIYEIYR